MPTVGVDEAGKGAVLGSMFVAAVAYPDGTDLGVADSKTVAPERREELAEAVEERSAVAVVEVPCDAIDEALDGDHTMNDLVLARHAEAVRRVVETLGDAGGDDDSSDVDGVVADASDVDADRFERRLDGRVAPPVTAHHGAEEEHDAVAAASILAKVRRDAHIYAHDCGSGYPSDPETKQYIEETIRATGEPPRLARWSWSTTRDAVKQHAQSGLDDFE